MTLQDPSQNTSWFRQTFVRVFLWISTLPRWARPPAIGAVFLFFLTAVRGLFLIALHPGPKAILALVIALAVASAGGALAGLAFVLVRIPFKHLGIVGDLLTGVTLSCVYVFGILVPAKYWFGDDTLQTHEDWLIAAVIAVAFGVVATVVYWVNVRQLKKG